MRTDRNEYAMHAEPRILLPRRADECRPAIVAKGNEARRAANRKPRPGALAMLARLVGGAA